MNVYGLIGYPLTHSFSKKYFSEKFVRENIPNSVYELFEIKEVADVKKIVADNPTLKGLNVTIPHKQQVIPFLDSLDNAAQEIGAVNVIKVQDGKLVGYNSDYYGFRQSLLNFLKGSKVEHALILGKGGAGKAVIAALKNLDISYTIVSRKKETDTITYDEINEGTIRQYPLIINTTPLGMYPKVEACPDLPYQFLTPNHFLFDLVYNPETTLFMHKGIEQGAKAINGLEMLHLQAEKAWEIWNNN